MFRKLNYNVFVLLLFVFQIDSIFAQDNIPGQVSGSFQSDFQYVFPDSAIGAPVVPSKVLMNGYGQITYSLGGFSAGIRYEAYLNPLLGIDPRYAGSGLPYRFASYQRDNLEVTIGNFYEQFGTGMTLRAYWEPLLGIDNNIDGVKIKFSPFKCLNIKGLVGRQRAFWGHGDGIVRGVDGELMLHELLTKVFGEKTQITLGGSFVSRFQKDDDPEYILPENVCVTGGRLEIRRGGFSLLGEYTQKINDPNFGNNKIYKEGNGMFITTSYAKKGLGITLSAKQLDNMDFRSDRNATSTNLMINFLPPMAKQHTWREPSLYLYNTQPNGEIGYQADLIYSFPKGSKIGGKYGISLALNYSKMQSIDTLRTGDEMGYTTNYGKFGKSPYYEDFNIDITKKLTDKLKFTYDLIFIKYNFGQLRSGVDYGKIVESLSNVIEITYKINKKNALRIEMQQMEVKKNDIRDDMGSWAMGLIEYTYAPHFFLTLMGEYNYGNNDEKKRFLYPNTAITFVNGGSRIMLGYGKQRAGILCIGGVCRAMPASNGFTLSVSSTF